MLRTRIMLIALGIVAVIVGLFAYSVWLRDQAARTEQDEFRLASIQQAWDLVTDAAVAQTKIRTLESIDSASLISGIVESDQALLQAVLGHHTEQMIGSTNLVRLDVYSDDDDLLFSSDPSYFAANLLGAVQPPPLDDAETITGIRITDGYTLGLSVDPIEDDGRRIGTTVIAVDLAPSLDLLGNLLNADIIVLDRSGSPLASSAADAYATLLDQVDSVLPQLIEGGVDDATLELASTTAIDAGGGRSGMVVAVRDITEETEQRQLAVFAVLFWALLIALVPLGLLWLYLNRAFRPLADAIEALTQLSRGRTDHYAELRSGDDEIGQITGAIEVFRQHSLQIERNADLEERRQRRQARFIRRQMATLSETLDEEQQASAMQDLKQIERMGSASSQDGQPPEFSDQLGLIGVALERMTARVRSQQRAMNDLIAELREALEMKTRLISLEQELEVARHMQENILPRSFPDLPGFTIAAQMRAAKEVGGDFYDVFQIDERRVGIAVADVSGKGIPAAFFMLITRTLLKAMALEGLGPARTVQRLNELLSSENEEMMFVTLFYAELDPVERRLTYANCGHNEPILATSNTRAKPLATTDGMALAVFDGLTFEESAIDIEPGDRLVMFTDGVTEAFDSEDRMFSDERLISLVDSLAEPDASVMLADILSAVDQFSGDAPQSDDITIIVLSAVDPSMAAAASERTEGAAAAQ